MISKYDRKILHNSVIFSFHPVNFATIHRHFSSCDMTVKGDQLTIVSNGSRLTMEGSFVILTESKTLVFLHDLNTIIYMMEM